MAVTTRAKNLSAIRTTAKKAPKGTRRICKTCENKRCIGRCRF